MYLFFSSDIYTLYKKDILSAISLPKDYCLHFRYPKEFVPSSIFNNLERLKQKEGIIVYVEGNDSTQELAQRNVHFLPIRNVRVKDIYYDKATDLVHVFLELGVFIKTASIPAQLASNTRMDLPPHKFIWEIGNISSSITEWHEKVAELVAFDSDFDDHLFFKIDILHSEKYYKDQVEITFDEIEYSSYFELKEDKDYVLDVAIYNSAIDVKKFEDYLVKLACPSDYFFITNPENISIGAKVDNRKYKIITKDTSSLSSFAYLKVQSFKKTNSAEDIIYDELVRFHIARSKNKLWRFCGFTLLGVAGASLLTYASGLLGSNKQDGSVILILMVAAVCLMLWSVGGLFYYFNKRS